MLYLKKEMKDFKDISKYIKDKLNPDEEQEKEIKVYNCIREIPFKDENNNEINNNNTPQGFNKNIFTMDLNIYLYKDKIKIKINEIEDNLKSNYLMYESSFYLDDFNKVAEYYIKFGGIETIYNFLCELFEKNQDTLIKKNDDKIIIKVKFVCGLKEEEISLEILNKDLSLDSTLKNLKQSIKIINKNMNNDNSKIKDIVQNENNKIKAMIENLKNEMKKNNSELKEEIKKDLLEKVYPVGSYYWSEKNISPDEIFGGNWQKINGRFLFASDANHSVGNTGGEEMHTLTIDEIPSHNHQIYAFNHYSYLCSNLNSGSWRYPYRTDYDFMTHRNSDSTGGGSAHNNMPPYIVANCWKRIK